MTVRDAIANQRQRSKQAQERRYAEWAARREYYSRLSPGVPQHTQLTASQHILHLLLTVFTGGLWAPVWIARAASGNRKMVIPPPGPSRAGN